MFVTILMLVFASLARTWLSRHRPEHDMTELRRRIQSWWWMILTLFGFLVWGRIPATWFLGFLSFLALKEFLSIVPTRLADRRIIFWAYLAIPIQYTLIGMQQYGLFIVFIPVWLFLFLPIRAVLIGETKGFIRSITLVQWACLLTVFCLSHLAALLSLLPESAMLKYSKSGSVGLLLYVLIITQANDIFQFIWGKTIGRHKIVPKISPNKTWEGFLGGAATTSLLSAFLAIYLTPASITFGLLLGLVLAIAGFFGDCVMSSVKRDLEIKDASQLIPGHGG
ncbi:MAG: phosphatidate cytidylyltransferase, partial [Planctomycetota bacterium]